MSTPTKRLGIVINLEGLRDLMREFMSEVVTDDDDNIHAWPFETFLQWAKKRQQQAQVYCWACRAPRIGFGKVHGNDGIVKETTNGKNTR